MFFFLLLLVVPTASVRLSKRRVLQETDDSTVNDDGFFGGRDYNTTGCEVDGVVVGNCTVAELCMDDVYIDHVDCMGEPSGEWSFTQTLPEGCNFVVNSSSIVSLFRYNATTFDATTMYCYESFLHYFFDGSVLVRQTEIQEITRPAAGKIQNSYNVFPCTEAQLADDPFSISSEIAGVSYCKRRGCEGFSVNDKPCKDDVCDECVVESPDFGGFVFNYTLTTWDCSNIHPDLVVSCEAGMGEDEFLKNVIEYFDTDGSGGDGTAAAGDDGEPTMEESNISSPTSSSASGLMNHVMTATAMLTPWMAVHLV